MQIENLFSTLWSQYIKLTPQAFDIKELFLQTQTKAIINDHIALRTLSHKRCNIDVLAKFFITLGYEKKDYYDFQSKKLDAHHFIHKNLKYPKVFISELKIEEFDKETQDILNSLVSKIPKDILNKSALLSSSRHWDISYKTYKSLYAKSEYAAWFYVFGYCANHFTIFVNDLEKFDTLESVNTFLKNNGYKLNDTGGEIKGNKEVFLEQSSTLAQIIPIKFIDGTYDIPSCFYEFAKRYTNIDDDLYQGFVMSSADKIFESTNLR